MGEGGEGICCGTTEGEAIVLVVAFGAVEVVIDEEAGE